MIKHPRAFSLHVTSAIAATTLAAPLLLAESPQTANIPEPPPTENLTDFIRYEGGDDGQGQLQTATVTYRHPDTRATVDLVGVVHVGDARYYEDLDAQLGAYETVLYELVGGPMPDDQDAPRDTPSGEMDFVKVLQKSLFKSLQLSDQLSGIDYGRDSFVHADATWEEFAQFQAERDESMMSIFMKAMAMEKGDEKMAALMEDANANMVGLMNAVMDFSPDRLKRGIAPMFDEAEHYTGALFGGEDKGSAIITDRNIVAMEVLDREVAAGKRDLSVFYGAAHMPDFEARLLERGYIKGDTEWLIAWDVPAEGDVADADKKPVNLIQHLLRDDEIVDSIFELFRQGAAE